MLLTGSTPPGCETCLDHAQLGASASDLQTVVPPPACATTEPQAATGKDQLYGRVHGPQKFKTSSLLECTVEPHSATLSSQALTTGNASWVAGNRPAEKFEIF